MKIYCMSDIHGCLAEFEDALSLVIDNLEKDGTMLLLLGDYIHRGSDSVGVLNRIMNLQYKYGSDKVVALMGNHEELVLRGHSTINNMIESFDDEHCSDDEDEDRYIQWMENLPYYYTEDKIGRAHV